MAKKILVILGQPQRKSYGGALAQAYIEGAQTAGAEVQTLFLGELAFHPAPSTNGPAELEPDLQRAQAAIRWAEHLVFVYPIWWGTIPALLKGFIERTFAPGFAVNFHQDSPRWDKLLCGRSARLIVTMNTPPWIYRWLFGRPGHVTMKRTILKFCGIQPVKITDVGPVQKATATERERWLAQVRLLGQNLL
ncbi:MAG: NAD(P)H-dependent oxidoreductase [Gammaproteobacteria bacterium]|nr:NAD(P)H-dependent oxidoreductase [Gammaproteobacteria bacterium]